VEESVEVGMGGGEVVLFDGVMRSLFFCCAGGAGVGEKQEERAKEKEGVQMVGGLELQEIVKKMMRKRTPKHNYFLEPLFHPSPPPPPSSTFSSSFPSVSFLLFPNSSNEVNSAVPPPDPQGDLSC
jgi:hypothetical protein